jgi:cytochrome c5
MVTFGSRVRWGANASPVAIESDSPSQEGNGDYNGWREEWDSAMLSRIAQQCCRKSELRCPLDFDQGRIVVAFCVAILSLACVPSSIRAGSPPGDPQRGYELLTQKPYLPADFDQEVFDSLWQTWSEPRRSIAENATLPERRAMTRDHYGITVRPDSEEGQPLQYVVSADGQWSMNCFACHGGSVYGMPYAGAPNTQYALEMLTRDVRTTKLKLGKPLTHMDLGSIFMPLGKNRGTTNAVMFGVALLAHRDSDLNLLPKRLPPAMTHHDMDAPPWWHFRKKKHLYIDGFAPKTHRALMQFMLVEQNGPEQFRQWDEEFRDVFAFLDSLIAPRYPLEVDPSLVQRGAEVFEANCAECHGTHGDDEEYPERLIPWEEVRTDRVRLDALQTAHRETYQRSWFAEGKRDEVVLNPSGYVAPPLDGIWASAPYFHNGSVPTLWHLLHPEDRPIVWRREVNGTAGSSTRNPVTAHAPEQDGRRTQPLIGFDAERVGLRVQSLREIPSLVNSPNERLEYFDTRDLGKSSSGHDFPSRLTEQERRALLEFLKTL